MADRPGFMDTFRQGWAPARQRGGGPPVNASTTAAPKARPGAAKGRGPAPKGAARCAPAASKASPALLKRRDELSRSFAELQWDLGGIAYEMARRDHYRLEVLNAQAARLQEIDAELGQIERMVKLDEAGATGSCPSCGALQARGASYCWRCGEEVGPAEPKAAAAKAEGDQEATAAKTAPAQPKVPKIAKLRRPRGSKSKAAAKAPRKSDTEVKGS